MPKWAFGWSVGWRVVAPGSLRRLAAAAGRRNGVEGRYTGSLRGQGVCGDCFDPFTHQERLLTARMVVLALLRRLGFWAPLEAHHANLPRLAQARSLGAIASALTPCLPRLRLACLRPLECLFSLCCCCISVLNRFSRCARVGPGGCGAVVPQARGTETAIAAAQ